MQVGNGVGAREESAADLPPGGVPVSMENARAAVRGLAREGQLGARAIKFGAPFNELLDVLGAFFNKKAAPGAEFDSGAQPSDAASVDGIVGVMSFRGMSHGGNWS